MVHNPFSATSHELQIQILHSKFQSWYAGLLWKLHTNFNEAAYVYNTFDDIDIFVKHFWDDLPEFTATSQT